MIKKLQKKFIMIIMGSLALIVLTLLGSINMLNLYKMNNEMNGAISILSANEGEFPHYKNGIESTSEQKFGFEMTPETQFQTRYFVVKVDKNNDIIDINTKHVAAVTSDSVESYVRKVLISKRKSGLKANYKYAVINESYGHMLIFIDCRIQLHQAASFLLISGSVALVILLFVFIFVLIFSKNAIKPIIQSIEKQKRFITDAGHEIKTPLAIISANADVLEVTSGKNEWITSIRNQTNRLDKLVRNLLMLSKMNEDDLKLTFADFNLSDVVDDASSSFEVIAKKQNKKFITDIQKGLEFHGDEGSIIQLISTLVDNAIKYSNENGTIKISLAAVKKRAKIEVYNTVDKIDKGNQNKLFDRFYRADASRSRETGGYGIGLSIVKSIVEMYHGKVSATSKDGKSICFTVII